ncbi:MAG TPA: hypothetical protein VIH31_01095 [Candidatus Paceibacterota bacterium]
MLNKHFFKSLFGFIAILFIGLVILFVLNEYDRSGSDFKATVEPTR